MFFNSVKYFVSKDDKSISFREMHFEKTEFKSFNLFSLNILVFIVSRDSHASNIFFIDSKFFVNVLLLNFITFKLMQYANIKFEFFKFSKLKYDKSKEVNDLHP